MQILINANLLFLFLLIITFLLYFSFNKEKKLDFRLIIFHIPLVLCLFTFIVYFLNYIFPITPLVSWTVFLLTLTASGIIIIKNFKQVNQIRLFSKTNFIYLAISIIFFNLLIFLLFFINFKYNLPIAVSSNSDLSVHEYFIYNSQHDNLNLNYCKESITNIMHSILCRDNNNYPRGSHALVAFIDNLLPFHFIVKSMYIGIIFAIVMTAFFVFFLNKLFYLFLILPILFHPSIYSSVSLDHMSQVVATIFFVPILLLFKHTGINFWLMILIINLGLLIVYPYAIIVLIPFYLFSLYWQWKEKQLFKDLIRSKLKFLAAGLLLGMVLLFSYITTSSLFFIVNENNPGTAGKDIVSISAILGIDYLRNYNNLYSNPNFINVLILAYFFVLFFFAFKLDKKYFIPLLISSFFVTLGLYPYWLYKLNYFWLLLFIVFFGINLSKKVIINNNKNTIWFTAGIAVLSIIISANWIIGVNKNYYDNRYRGVLSRITASRLEEFSYIQKNITRDKLALVHLDFYLNALLVLYLPNVTYSSNSIFVYINKDYQLQQSDNYELFISNFDLHAFDQLIIDKKTFKSNEIPLIFKEDKKFKDIIIYKKAVNNFSQIVFPYNNKPLYIRSEKEMISLLGNKNNLLIKYYKKNLNTVCNYFGDSGSFVYLRSQELPFKIVNIYEIKDLKDIEYLKSEINRKECV